MRGVNAPAGIRRILCAAALAFTGVPGTAAAGPGELALQAEREGDSSLRVKVRGAIPKGAILTIRIHRESRTPARKPSVTLLETKLPFDRDGEAEALFTIGEEFQVPGRYRVQASFDPAGQYPAVLKAVGSAAPAPAEVVLNEALVSKAYLQAMLKEQACLVEAFQEVGDFIEKMNEMETLAAKDRKQGVEAWAAWQGTAEAGLQAIIGHGREVGTRFYPETYAQFVEEFCAFGLLQMQSRKFIAAQTGAAYHATGFLKDVEHIGRDALAPYVAAFRAETVYYHLAVVDALYSSTTEELAKQESRPDPPRWDRQRAHWEGLVALWKPDPGTAGPAAAREALHGKELSALGEALVQWWAAEEARLFHPELPDGGKSRDRKQTVKDRFSDVRRLLEQTAGDEGK